MVLDIDFDVHLFHFGLNCKWFLFPVVLICVDGPYSYRHLR
jgi:hypothetical protein